MVHCNLRYEACNIMLHEFIIRLQHFQCRNNEASCNLSFVPIGLYMSELQKNNNSGPDLVSHAAGNRVKRTFLESVEIFYY